MLRKDLHAMIAHRYLAAVLLALLAAPLSAQTVDWTPDAARHLLNRAGFGGTPAEVRALHELGLTGAVEHLLNQSQCDEARQLPAFVPEHLGRPSRETIQAAKGEDARRALIQESRAKDRRQMEQIRGWWIHRMIQTPAPLEEKMVLFWHGHFTSGYQDVKNSYHLLRQHELFRLHGMGNFRLLLHEVSKDPAMLAYLDNNENRKGRPNENFAREVMELFTVGIGNYTEKDITEAARAFTGWTFQGNRFVVTPRQHDSGTKTILGSEGRFTGTEVLDLLLSTEAAPKTIAHKILSYFMGVEPSAAMVERHAKILRDTHFEIRPLLHSLFTSPEFYAENVVAGQVLSPVDYLVSLCRRLKEQPPAPLLSLALRQLGQDL
ncbi:MAG TPA: DUF1800 domain-containing protein, partial [Planctomycetota bacterium]|nr:DUF1800 domain-containing protein [Planctomycetota bacterium]